MNNTQRKELAVVVNKLSALEGETVTIEKLHLEVKAALEVVEAMSEDEQDKFDNLSEAAQEGSKGEALQTVLDELETAFTSLYELADMGEEERSFIADSLGTVIDALESI